VSTTIIPTKPPWSGLADFDVRPQCQFDFLKGAKGGYVHVFASAATSREFADRVGAALKNLDLTPCKLDNIESIRDVSTLSDEWQGLCSQAVSSGDVVFGKFFLYDREDDTTSS
jgi:hypothetical protein